MACYKIVSDEQFMCCNDSEMQLMVYEIDSIHITPVQHKHWTHVKTVDFRDGQEYKALKLSDTEIVHNRDLKRLMSDLMSLRMMVNREGLCFLKAETNVSETHGVGYYRMFDLFDWSKYRVNSRVNTRWGICDILTGRPVADNYWKALLDETEAELKDNKLNHVNEVAELKCKHMNELAEQRSYTTRSIPNCSKTQAITSFTPPKMSNVT